jgi:hypothetical protein
MDNKRFTLDITLRITIILLLIGGTAATSILLNTAHAQTATLGKPYFVEEGKITGQKELGPNRTQFNYTANGTMNGSTEVTDTGEFVSISRGPGLMTTKNGVITTKDDETANYTGIDVGNFT